MVRFLPNGDWSDQGKAMCVLEARRVKKSFGEGEARVEAVRGVDFQVRRGEFVAVMGRSGSGKSTLLSMLGGIEPPTSGQIFLEGTDLATLDDDQRTLIRRRKVGFVFQMFNLLPILTAVENVTLPLELDGVPAAEANRRAVEMLDRVDMSARREHIPGTLSGGEQQRVAVARALAIRPTILLADEPTGNLDSANGQQITRLLRRLVDEQKQTLVIVTHDLLVADQADRVVHLSDGRVVDGDGSVAGPSIGGAAGERA
jgi:putative ABC transport system ATP-binding protein